MKFLDIIRPRLLLTIGTLVLLAACNDSSTSSSTATTVDSSAEAVTASTGYRRINEPNPDDPLDAHIYELDNGLQVYLTENHEEPRFYAEIATRAGSKHDPADATGLAHYLEQLL